jgi:SAM-dependent methyltransferase
VTTDHFSGYAADYARFRPGYPPELFHWLAARCPQRELAWDCGTGNGQAARALTPHFDRIHATDLSAEQIRQAQPDPRIDYRAAAADVSGLADASCDLVIVAQALHWFCNDTFYAEVRRVLKPGGLFAAWTYTLLQTDPELNAAIAHFHDHTVGPWWPPERRWVNLAYAGMPFPFPDLPTPGFEIRQQWKLTDLLAYVRTWSATQRFIKENSRDPTQELGTILTPLWGDPVSAKMIIWPIALRAGRMRKD